MSDRTALLRAITASPADRLVRLVYADYLDDLGTPTDVARAEFIRAQCEFEELCPPCGGPHRSDRPEWEVRSRDYDQSNSILFKRELDTERNSSPELRRISDLRKTMIGLFDEYWLMWVAEVAELVGLPVPTTSAKSSLWQSLGTFTGILKRPGWPYAPQDTSVGVGDPKGIPSAFCRLVFSGGFADELWIDPTFNSAGLLVKRWASVCPARRLVLDASSRIGGNDFHVDPEQLVRVGTVVLGRLSLRNFGAAIAAANLAGVRSLECKLPTDGGHLLATSDLYPKLERLWLSNDGLGNEFRAVTVGRPMALRQLVLDFGETDVRLHGVSLAEIAMNRGYAEITSLHVRHFDCSETSIRQAFVQTAWPSLTTLNLETLLRPDGLIALIEGLDSPILKDLTIGLDRNAMVDRSVPRIGADLYGPPDRNDWMVAISTLTNSTIVRRLIRLRLFVEWLRPESMTVSHLLNKNSEHFLGLPAQAVALLAAKLAELGTIQQFEIAGVAVNAEGREVLEKHLGSRVVLI